MEYEIGDFVRIRSDLKCNEKYGIHIFIPHMEKFKGKIVEITDAGGIIRERCYRIKGLDGEESDYLWTKEMFDDEPFKVGDKVRVDNVDEVYNTEIGTVAEVDDDCNGVASLKYKVEFPTTYSDGSVKYDWFTRYSLIKVTETDNVVHSQNVYEELKASSEECAIKPQLVDVGYNILGNGILKEVYWLGHTEDNKYMQVFEYKDGFNRFCISSKCIDWILPHGQIKR